MNSDAYARGFAKAANAHGVDAVSLAKYAAAKPLALRTAMDILKGVKKVPAIEAVRKRLANTSEASRLYDAVVKHTRLPAKKTDVILAANGYDITNPKLSAWGSLENRDPIAAKNLRAIHVLRNAREDLTSGNGELGGIKLLKDALPEDTYKGIADYVRTLGW